MNRSQEQLRTLVFNALLTVLFSGAILLVTSLTLGFRSFATTETVGFLFLVMICFSAFFGNLLVSVLVSLVAALCFDYFFLPPFGTLNVYAPGDWISLGVFLLIASVISKLTASAAKTKETNERLTGDLAKLTALGGWLVSTKNRDLTLTAVAAETRRLFEFPYCSIHVYAAGKWDHAFGSARSPMADQVEERVQKADLPLDWTVMVNEGDLGVRYLPIREEGESCAILAVKADEALPETLKALAYLVGSRLVAT